MADSTRESLEKVVGSCKRITPSPVIFRETIDPLAYAAAAQAIELGTTSSTRRVVDISNKDLLIIAEVLADSIMPRGSTLKRLRDNALICNLWSLLLMNVIDCFTQNGEEVVPILTS
ncbi:hypothetical protein CY34DRAFT_810304 [Suillus luteus UH-Slu-Lm8-n1]|uniref:Uncharacterized protein n=1 Tax=Suillus luteus UH-Slu-Lm8-n1 TaxID=930992 RepID=A0A0C9ZJ74_9AGAM|nr:hypothetical protein CY34DRAFT_810304 [Suillus luteus UH-Slu-Lm8-n1]